MGTRSVLVSIALGFITTLLVGCPPPGKPPAQWTGLPDPSDLARGCDEVGQHLAAEINGIVDRDFRGKRIALILGDIDNRTGSVPTNDFNYMRNRIKNTMMQSKLFRSNVRVFENRARWEGQRKKEFGTPDDDPLQEGKGQASTRPQERYTVLLNGDAYAVHGGLTHLYYIAFKLNRGSDGEEVFSHAYEVKYQQTSAKRH